MVQNTGACKSGTADPEGVVVGTVVATAASFLSTTSEIQLLTDPIKWFCHDWSLSFGTDSILNVYLFVTLEHFKFRFKLCVGLLAICLQGEPSMKLIKVCMDNDLILSMTTTAFCS